MLGRDIANHREMAAGIRSALDDLKSFSLMGVDLAKDYVQNPDDVAFRLMVDGSAVLLNPGNPKMMKWLENVYAPSQSEFFVYHPDPRDGLLKLEAPHDDLDKIYSTPFTSQWKLTEDGWSETVWDYSGSEVKKKDGGQTAEAAAIKVFDNGRGIVYWAQALAMRIAELEETERFVNTGPNILPIITGNVGPIGQAKQAIKKAIRAIFFPGRVEVNRPISNDTVSQILSVLANKREQLLSALNAVEQDTPERPVASDRELRMRAMVLYCNRVRAQLAKIYAVFGEELTFSPIIIQTPQDRLIELQIGDAVQPDNWAARRKNLVA